MASGRIDESQVSSDEEQEVFAGFTIEEIGDIRQARQTRQEQNLLCNVDGEIEDFFDLRSQERGSNSDVELYANEEEEVDEESSNEESAPEKNRPNAIQWSNTLREINVAQFSIPHGPTRDLGDNATAKDFFNLTNRFHVAVRLFSNRSQMTSKCGKNKKVAHEAIVECVTRVLTTF